MKTLKRNARNAVIFLTLIVLFNTYALAQQSISDLLDIPMLMSTAETRFDLAKEDAVILFDGQKEYWLPDNRLITFVHRIIWLNTEIARDHFGDHRIPYDSANRDFKTVIIRTWSDGQWWQTGETGIVETMPDALKEAYDYTNIREMMLLHNGMELPCIIEVAYYIEDKKPFRAGMEGIWTFAREEPSVQTWFALGLSKGQKPNVLTSGEIPPATQEFDEQFDLDVYWWKAGPLENLPRSSSEYPTLDSPFIAWSTWKSWNEFGNYLDSLFNVAMILDDTLKKSLDSLVTDARTDAEKAELIAEFVDSKIRYVDYPETYWLTSPREAMRVYNTAYGHRLDRTILACALFEQAGLDARKIFVGKEYGEIQHDVPTLGQMQGIGLWLAGNNLEAYYNPAEGTLACGNSSIDARDIWRPGIDGQPIVLLVEKDQTSFIDIQLDLGYDKDKKALSGTGYLRADNALNPYGKMMGLEDEAVTYLEEVASGIIEGAKVTGFNPSVFEYTEVIIGFKIELEKPEVDFQDRLKIVIGEPSGGIMAMFSDDVHIYELKHPATIQLPGFLNQQVKLKIGLEGLEIIYTPENKIIANEAGSFSTIVVKHDEKLTVTRKLELLKSSYKADDWPPLKELLLAQDHQQNKTLLFKPKTDNKE